MYEVPRNPLGIIQYALRALGQQKINIDKLWLFISFELRQMPPSKARELISQLSDEGLLVVEDGTVSISTSATSATVISTSLRPSLGELLGKFVSGNRLSRAVGMDDAAVEFTRKSTTPLQIEAVVHGTRDYKIVLDEAAKCIRHNCPDWRRVYQLRRFCKHVAKLILLLEKYEAERILDSMLQEPWRFEDI